MNLDDERYDPTGDPERSGHGGDSEMERRLRDALEAMAHASVPDSRRPPAADALSTRPVRRVRPAWVAPVSVAAAVVVVAGTVGLAVSRQGTTLPTPADTTPAMSTPSPSSPVPSVSSSGGTTATDLPTTRPGSPPATGGGSGGYRIVSVGGASVAVPTGWQLSAPTGESNTWCIDPVGSPTADAHGSPVCRIQLSTQPTPKSVDADIPGGVQSNPQFCDPGVNTPVAANPLKDYHDAMFGGRSAEYRSWTYACSDGSSTEVVQYQVLTPQSWVVFSQNASDPSVRSAVDVVAADSKLPAETGQTRVYDRGIVRSVVTQTDGVTMIQVDRVVEGWPNQSTVVYTYRIPAGVTFTGSQGVFQSSQLLGRTVSLNTDGTVVTEGVVLG